MELSNKIKRDTLHGRLQLVFFCFFFWYVYAIIYVHIKLIFKENEIECICLQKIKSLRIRKWTA